MRVFAAREGALEVPAAFLERFVGPLRVDADTAPRLLAALEALREIGGDRRGAERLGLAIEGPGRVEGALRRGDLRFDLPPRVHLGRPARGCIYAGHDEQ